MSSNVLKNYTLPEDLKVTQETNGTTVTFTFDVPVDSFVLTTNAAWRLNSVTVYYQEKK